MEELCYGINSATKPMSGKRCPKEYWLDVSIHAQTASNVLNRPIAFFATGCGISYPPRLYLLLNAPAPDTRPEPIALHLVGNHFYSVNIKPNIKVERPEMPVHHRTAWETLQITDRYKSVRR